MNDTKRLTSYHFSVEISGIEGARFQKCEGLEAMTDVFEVEEGGLNTTTHKFIDETRWPNVILEKGITNNNDLFNWVFKTTSADNEFERKNGSIVLRDQSEREIKRWNFFRAFPCRYVGPKLIAALHGEYAIEKVEIVHEGIEVDVDTDSMKDGFPFQVGQNSLETEYTSEFNDTYFIIGHGTVGFDIHGLKLLIFESFEESTLSSGEINRRINAYLPGGVGSTVPVNAIFRDYQIEKQYYEKMRDAQGNVFFSKSTYSSHPSIPMRFYYQSNYLK